MMKIVAASRYRRKNISINYLPKLQKEKKSVEVLVKIEDIK